ncbi:MAG: PTPA-CTERM sorting domain-containing protein [Lyngbya sp. HA4199-MV5]|jgi:hypothetical protein|nr:PTPA-CTERM sorting domain-containing protein [Lyngbya sp. HA4199-MV5]
MDAIWAAIILFLIAIFSGGNGGNNQANQSKRQAHKPSIEQPAPIVISQNQGNKPDKQPEKPPTSVPTPALLPGLIGLGVAALRKQKLAKDETSV